MADIRAILKINDVGNGVIDSYTTNVETNNLSKKPYTTDILSVVNSFTINDKTFGGAIGTPIGISTIDDLRFGVEDSNNVRKAQYNGLDFGYTNSSGVFNLTITIVGTDIIKFKIYFDQLRGLYPTNYSYTDVDGVTHNISGNTNTWIEIEQPGGYGTTTINFSQWSAPNTMVGITYIENVEIDIYLDKKWIINYETQSQKISDASKLIFTPIASSGSILLKDVDNTLYERAVLGHLNTNVFELELYLNNQMFQKHVSLDSPMYSSNSTMQFQLSNMINKMNNIVVPSKEFYAGDTPYDLLEYILDQYEVGYLSNHHSDMFGILHLTDIDNNITYGYNDMEFILERIEFDDFTLESGTIIQQLEKLCTLLFLNCYVNDNNEIFITSARPLLDDIQDINNNNIIDVPYTLQYNELEYDILVDNKFDSIEVE